MIKQIQSYAADKSAAAAIEYTLLAAGIALAIVGVLFIFGQDLANLYNGLTDATTQE